MFNGFDKETEKYVKKYIKKLKKRYRIDEIILFGSYAKGTQTKDSDIDLAIISPDVEFDETYQLADMLGLTCEVQRLSRNSKIFIEPYPINSLKFKTEEGKMINEINKTGIKLNY